MSRKSQIKERLHGAVDRAPMGGDWKRVAHSAVDVLADEVEKMIREEVLNEKFKTRGERAG